MMRMAGILGNFMWTEDYAYTLFACLSGNSLSNKSVRILIHNFSEKFPHRGNRNEQFKKIIGLFALILIWNDRNGEHCRWMHERERGNTCNRFQPIRNLRADSPVERVCVCVWYRQTIDFDERETCRAVFIHIFHVNGRWWYSSFPSL